MGMDGRKEGSRHEMTTPAAPQPPFGAVIREQTVCTTGWLCNELPARSVRDPSWPWAEQLMQIKIHKRIQPPNTETN